MACPFQDSTDAGKKLALALSPYAKRTNTLVLALPRGGVPVAYEVARSLSLPMDIWLVRKLGVPGHEELALGAIAAGGIRYLNQDLVTSMRIPAQNVEHVIAAESKELQRRDALYRKGRPAPTVKDMTVIIVDDGLATGASMRAAIDSLRHAGAAHIVAAAPVGAAQACHALKDVADTVVCLSTPEPFYGVGQWYGDFSQVSDQTVQTLLKNILPVI